jgi:hypothetical protein
VDDAAEDVTEAILTEAALPEVAPDEVNLQTLAFDHIHDLRKHERT